MGGWWSMKVNTNICKKVKNIISWKVYHDEPTCFEYLWQKLLCYDKRSFTEYFNEQHNIVIDENVNGMSFKEFLLLCIEYNVGGYFTNNNGEKV